MSLRAVCLILLAPLAASAGVRLEWKFAPGDSFVIERVYQQKQEIDVKGRAYKQDTTSTWQMRFTVKEKSRGNALLAVTIEDVAYKTTGVGHPVAFDDKLAARMKGVSLSFTVTPRGEVKKLLGYDEFLKKVSEGKKDTENVLRTLFSEEGLQETFEEIFAFLPAKAVDKGDHWKRAAVDPVPPFGSFKSAIEYTYGGQEDGLHVIRYAIKTTYQKPKDTPELFRLVKAELTGEAGQGRFFFDPDAGRLIRGEKTMTVRGQVTLETGGVETELRFVSENRMKLRLAPGK